MDKVYVETKFWGPNVEVAAATDINLVVRTGQITGIIGESGSGKSTVARCIMQLVKPTTGSVLVDGTDVTGARGADFSSAIQYIFQDPYRSLNPRRTIGQSITEGLVNRGVSQAVAMKQAAEAMGMVGLTSDMLSRFPHQFSGGQRQRVCIARAVIMEPKILIADEAVSALDVTVQAQVLKLFEKIRDELGIGILFITHDLRVAAQICNTIIVMQRGRIVEAGDAVDVLNAPSHTYTRALVGAAPAASWDFQNFRPQQSPVLPVFGSAQLRAVA